MRFDRLKLTNFKPYGDADVELRDGVTVIHGLNGSGKSSLLEACFFALYGATALPGTLEDVVTNGEEDATIDLWFTHEGESYHIERRLRHSGDRTTTAKCALTGPDATADGARDVRRFIADLLRMDADAFVNCAYVRQGEVNKLINATPGQRQDMIDDLLQLGVLESYRERAGSARLGVEDVLENRRGGLEKLEAQIAAKEDAELYDRLNALESELSERNAEIERIEENKARAETARAEATDILDSHEELQSELEAVRAEIDSLEEDIRETETRRSDLGDRVRGLRSDARTKDAEIETALAETDLDEATGDAIAARQEELAERAVALRDDISDRRVQLTGFRNQSERLAEKADEQASQAEEKSSRADDLEAAADAAETEAASRADSRTELETERAELESTFEAAPVDPGEAATYRDELRARRAEVRETETEQTAALQSAREAVADAEALLEEGKCPECGQPVAESPHVEALDEDRERVADLEADLEATRERREALETKLETASQLVDVERRLAEIENTVEMLTDRIDEQREAAADKRETAETLREEATELRSTTEETRAVAEQKASEASETEATIEAREDALEAVTAARERLDDLDARRGSVEALREEIERIEEKRADLGERNDERREWLADKRKRRNDLREAVDGATIEQARERLDRAENYLEDAVPELERLTAERDDLNGQIGGVKQDIRQLEALREERERVAARVAALESLHAETEELEAMYAELRAELRQRNVETLERMLNETFDLVYGNDAYSHIELDGEYALTVYQKDGRPLDPEQLSGGERALFNLSLRCAIYRLLAEGIEGAAPTPPLILDEPTVFLDSGHVSRLVDLVEEMRGFGVRQIVIVSHDDELVGAADDLVTVEKNPTTNRSSVRRESTATVAALGELVESDD
ncbi:DNA double-strand break repair ATPase Rad50 [Haloferacaceae archaeon DSL9]